VNRRAQILQNALLAKYNRAQIENIHAQALAATLDQSLEGRAIQLTLEGQSTALQYTGDPADLLEIAQNCLEILDGRNPAVKTSHIVSFANRRLEN
jgi:hypothetical protein